MSNTLAYLLANHCAPAICGIKASNLINCRFDMYDNLLEEIDELNQKYNPRYEFIVLKKTRNNALILVYKRQVLEDSVYKEDNMLYLKENGYPVYDGLDCMLEYLKDRLANNKDFPNEIGVFLGYSLDDIIAFNDKNKECLYVGIWKVYYDVEGKLKIFEKYNKCRNVVIKLLDNGFNIERIFR